MKHRNSGKSADMGFCPHCRSVPRLGFSSHLSLKLAGFLLVCPDQHSHVGGYLSQYKHYLND